MSMTDPIADMLSRIRNAQAAGHDSVSVPQSKLKRRIVEVLKAEGFVEGYIDDEVDGVGKIKIFLRYDSGRRGVIRGVERVSSPGRRVYVRTGDIPRVRNGLGIAILTTPRGVLTDLQARRAGVGGEVLCQVW